MLQLVFDDLKHLLSSVARGLKYFDNVELLYPSDEFQTNLRTHNTKRSLLSCGQRDKSDDFVLCFSNKDPICLKLVR